MVASLDQEFSRRVLLVDDHPVVRDSLSLRLSQDPLIEVCGAVGTVSRALKELDRLRPDLVVVDINLPDGHGLDLIKEIHRRFPSILILVFSLHEDALYGERAMLAGARGYVSKSASPEEVVNAVHRILAGKVVVSEKVLDDIVATKTGKKGRGSDPVRELSDTELEVFHLLGEGFTTKQIAEKLKRSSKTIDTYRLRIKKKLKIRSAVELVAYAGRWVADRK